MQPNFWLKLNRPILALAPMAGVTDSAFRQICKEHGVDVVYSEMASATALVYSPAKTLRLLQFAKSERPYVVQLFGKHPEHFAKAAKLLSNPSPLSKGRRREATEGLIPDGLDINFGCPARKVMKTGAGCALMADRKLAREIISAVCENTQLPVSIKIRAGIKKNTALDFIKYLKDLPFQAVMIHGRTYESGFAGPADFKVAEKIKKIIPDKIVLANGGINTPEDALQVLQKYPSLDGLGIARGAWGKPYLFRQIKEVMKLGKYDDYDFKKIKKIMIKHAELIWKDKKSLGMFEIRKHLAWYVKGFPGASDLRRQLVQIKNFKEIKDILKNY